MSTLFTKIISGEVPSYKIQEDMQTYAFLSIKPIARGHTLVVLKKEVDKWTDLTDMDLGRLMTESKKIAQKLEKAFGVSRVAVIIAGFEMPHAHVHLIPCNDESELSFANAHEASFEELTDVQNIITSTT